MGEVIKRKWETCSHTKYLVSEKLNYVECGLCGKELNPMWVLAQMCNRENRANMEVDRLKKIAEKADSKNRCKCEHCGKMTRIQK